VKPNEEENAMEAENVGTGLDSVQPALESTRNPIEAEKSDFTPSVDLLAASHRSDAFPQDWSDERRQRSLDRYKKWLRLKQLHPRSPLAPTRDIDLFWHLHMLSPVAYYRDCQRLFGLDPVSWTGGIATL
jgi:hypothetical protein